MTNVEFLFDFGSPNAYLAHRVIPQIEKRTGVSFDYIPVLLGGVFKLTGNQSPMAAFGHIKNKLEYEQLETQRFIRHYGLKEFVFNSFFPVNTLAIMRGAVAAQQGSGFAHYVDVMFRSMWEKSKKLDDPAIIRGVLRDEGFDADGLMDLAQSDSVKQTLLNNTEAAVARGVFGIPTFFVGSEIFFGKDRLRDVETQILHANGR